MDDEPIDLGPIDVAAVIRDLMDVARIALRSDMLPPSEEESVALIAALMTVIDERMPEELQVQDRRVQAARTILSLAKDGEL